MPDTITIEVPADAPDRDLERVEREAGVARRRAKIKRLYKPLKRKHGRDEAFQRLHEKFGESVRMIRMIVYGG